MRYLYLLVLMLWGSLGSASALNNAPEDKITVVATFSILADMAEQVGGDLVDVHSLVGWNQDAHVYQASPNDIKLMRKADVLVMNGLGFEFWLYRLVDVSGFSGLKVVATDGIDVLNITADSQGNPLQSEHEQGHDGHHHHASHEDSHGEDDNVADPHAWHSIEAAKIYVKNIRNAFMEALPERKQTFMERSESYLQRLSALQNEVSSLFDQIPAEKKKVMVPHDAFAYLARDFGLNFYTLQGASTKSDMSAADLARVVRGIKKNKIQAIYSENVSNNKLIKQVVKETGIHYGGELVSGALSVDVAPSYLELMRYNLNLFVEGIK